MGRSWQRRAWPGNSITRAHALVVWMWRSCRSTPRPNRMPMLRQTANQMIDSIEALAERATSIPSGSPPQMRRGCNVWWSCIAATGHGNHVPLGDKLDNVQFFFNRGCVTSPSLIAPMGTASLIPLVRAGKALERLESVWSAGGGRNEQGRHHGGCLPSSRRFPIEAIQLSKVQVLN